MSALQPPIRVMRIIARLNIGGPAIHVVLLTEGLNDDAFRSTLVTGVVGAAEGDMSYLAHERGIEPLIIPTLGREISPLADLVTLTRLVRLMRKERPHVVHTHTAKAGFVGRLAARLAGVPVVVHTFHGHVFHGYFGPVKTGLFIRLERMAARVSDAILTISERLRDDLVSYRIAPPEKIKVLPLGLALEPFSDLDNLRGNFRGELAASQGWPPDAQLVGIVGRLVPVKNHALFFETARQVAARLPEARFVVVGDGEMRAALEEQVQALGLADRVCFTGWRSDLPALYADLDAVVISSHNEGTPVSLIEAMAAGVPVVSTAVGGVPDLLDEGRLGRLTPPGEAGPLAEAILDALAEGRGPRTSEARRTAFEKYGSARLVSDVRRLYTGLLAAKGLPVQDRTL